MGWKKTLYSALTIGPHTWTTLAEIMLGLVVPIATFRLPNCLVSLRAKRANVSPAPSQTGTC